MKNTFKFSVLNSVLLTVLLLSFNAHAWMSTDRATGIAQD